MSNDSEAAQATADASPEEEALRKEQEREALENRKVAIRASAPGIQDYLCAQIAALYPYQIVPIEERHFAMRAMTSGRATLRDPVTDVGYGLVVWPASSGRGRNLRLYITLPTGEIFFIEKAMADAKAMVDVRPPFPSYVRRQMREFVSRNLPNDDAAAA